MDYDQYSTPVKLQGELKAKGELLGFLTSKNDVIGKICTVSVGNLDIVIGNQGNSFTTINHPISARLEVNEYDIIIVKQEYLFEELSTSQKWEF